MHIHDLFLDGDKRLTAVKVHFPKARRQTDHFGRLSISVLIGENGCGKTTILRNLARTLSGSHPLKNEVDVATVGYECDEGPGQISWQNREWLRSGTVPHKVIVSSYATIEQHDTHQREPSVSPVVYEYLGPMKGTSSRRLPSLAGSYLPFLNALIHPPQATDLLSLLEYIGYRPELPLIQLGHPSKIANIWKSPPSPLKRQIVGHLRESGPKNPVGTPVPQHVRLAFDRAVAIYEYSHINKGRRLVDPSAIRLNLHAWLDDVKVLESAGISLINNLLLENIAGIRMPMTSLSSGEQSLFFRFFRLFESITDDSIVLIDEPETHLHPKWIQNYVSLLVQLFRNRSAHIILATHSPLIVADLPRECVVVLKANGQHIYQSDDEFEPTLGADLEAILEEIFGLEQTYGLQTKQIIDKVRARMTKNLPDALSLYRDLGDSAEKYKLFREMQALPEKESK